MKQRKKEFHTKADKKSEGDWTGPIKPPFGYYGAKQRIASQIVAMLPPHNAWVEAFCGSAAITLAKKPAPIEVINDLDGEIINLFAQLRNKPNKLCRAVALTPYAREEFFRARARRKSKQGLERARQFLVSTIVAATADGAIFMGNGVTRFAADGRS